MGVKTIAFMPWRISIVLFGICILTSACSVLPHAESSRSPTPKELAKQFAESWGGGVYHRERAQWELKRHWVGTLKTAIQEETDDSLRTEDETVRFNVLEDEVTSLTIGSGGPLLIQSGRYGFSVFAYYRPSLPSIAALRDKKQLRSILAGFGPQQGVGEWSQWRWFTPIAPDQLRVLNVFAIMSGAEGKPNKIESLEVREAFLRLSDPDNPEDAKAFPSEDEQFMKRRAVIEAKDNAEQEPLRSHLKARHTLGDHELKTYFAAVHSFRENPDAELLKQLVVRLDDGTCEMSGLLERLFWNSSFEEKIGAWQPAQRREAIELLLDALPAIKGEKTSRRKLALHGAVQLAMMETGVSVLKYKANGLNIDMHTVRTSTGYESGYASFDIAEDCSLARAAEILRDEIRRLWYAKLEDANRRQ